MACKSSAVAESLNGEIPTSPREMASRVVIVVTAVSEQRWVASRAQWWPFALDARPEKGRQGDCFTIRFGGFFQVQPDHRMGMVSTGNRTQVLDFLDEFNWNGEPVGADRRLGEVESIRVRFSIVNHSL